MARLILALSRPGQSCSAPESAAVVAVNWGKAAALAQSLARVAARLELIPGMNSKDVEASVVPLLRALARQGTAHLHLGSTGKVVRLDFQGALTGGVCQ
ncbi:MAG: hypothetical protein NTZ09_16785 [Candidatus Hydrogenedentes bacterium]|nr:hypothetical protein [Candidatus Hydrogenedentota bacterium]